MHNFLIRLFESRNDPFEIAFLNLFHILFLTVIVGLTIALAFYLHKHEDKKKPTLRLIAYSLVVVYLSDFFFQHSVSEFP